MTDDDYSAATGISGQPRTFRVTAESAASPDKVFAILADAARWSNWAGPLVTVSYWEQEGSPPLGGVGAVRHLGTKRFFGIEEIVVYEPPHHDAYTVKKGIPTRSYRGDVRLTPEGTGTRITWDATYEAKYPATSALLGLFLRANVKTFASRLAAYAARA